MGQDIVESSLRNIHAKSGGAESQQQLQHSFKIDQDDGRSGKWRKMARNHDHGRGISNARAKGVILGVTAISRCASACEGW